jgi:hypothetical protein
MLRANVAPNSDVPILERRLSDEVTALEKERGENAQLKKLNSEARDEVNVLQKKLTVARAEMVKALQQKHFPDAKK